MQFQRHPASHALVRVHKLVNNFLIVLCFLFPRKPLTRETKLVQDARSTQDNFSVKLSESLHLGAHKYSCLDLPLRQFKNSFWVCLKNSLSGSSCLRNLLMRPNLMCKSLFVSAYSLASPAALALRYRPQPHSQF